MRKFICILCVVTCCLSLTACGGDPVDQVSSVVTYYDGESESVVKKDDIAAQIQNGTLVVEYDTIDEVGTSASVQLTMASDALKAALTESDLLRSEDEKYIQYSCGGADFYYTNDDRDNGLAAVVTYGMAYGFEPTVTTKEDVVSVLGEPTVSADATEEARSMLLRQGTGFTYIDYTFGTNHVSFFFYENTLSLTVIYQQGLWIY